MGTLQEEIAFFESVSTRATNNIRGEFFEQVEVIKSTLKSKSPVRSGSYKASWTIKKNSGSSVIAGVHIYNPVIHASSIDAGQPEGGMHPWAVAKREGRGPGLVVSQGRVWSAKAPGGVLGKTVTLSYERVLSQKLADAIIGVFK